MDDQTSIDPPSERQDKFHWHIETCRQCSDEPFNLCDRGAKLLKEAVAEIVGR